MSIKVEDVVSGYGTVDILHGISIVAATSKITCIFGPNGSGKTTLLKSIYGFITPRKGKILFDGQDITALRPHNMLKRGIAYVLQGRSIFPYLTVQENLKLGAWCVRGDNERTKESLEYVYGRFPFLREKVRSKAGALSGGQQRILEVARALMLRPKALLLDEPSASLAPKIVKFVYGEMEKLKEEDITVLLVDQNVRLATMLADYVYTFDMGRVRFEGSKEDFKKSMRRIVSTWLRF
jgi:branched-chain amino acid transport system ATP-binding protein